MIDIDITYRRDDFDLEVRFVQEARLTGVFGPNGAGKTTLLHLIAGLLRPARGTVRLHGRTVIDADAGAFTPAWRRRIALVFQDARLFPHRSVRGNLRFAQRRSGSDRFDAIVELLALRPLLARRAHELSGGEKQRVAIARALLSEPELLLLDEPLASVDEGHRHAILTHLEEIGQRLELPILFVSHDLGALLQVTDQLLLLDRGKVAGAGSFHTLSFDARALDVVHGGGLVNVIDMEVESHDDEGGLTVLRPQDASAARAAVSLRAPRVNSPTGSGVTVSIRPRDIALSMRPVEGISIRNQIPGEISHLTEHSGKALVAVDAGFAQPLIVEVSLQTVREMELAPGTSVVCLVKSNAVAVG